MQRMSARRFPTCHLGHVSSQGPAAKAQTAVWICEYPYRTIRLSGPSAECGDCPVWREMQRARASAQANTEEVRALETMIAL